MGKFNPSLDFLIVGQGLAGSLLAHILLQRGQKLGIIDDGHKGAASSVAAGIINPITGRRFVKSWMIEALLEESRNCYTALEALLGEKFYREENIIRILFNSGEENDWLARSGEPGYAEFIQEPTELGALSEKLQPVFNQGELLQSAQLDVPRLIACFKEYFKGTGLYIEESFDYDQIELLSDHVSYKDCIAKKIIFCEGYQASKNPYFSYLPFVLAKGETLIVKIPGLDCTKMIKHKVFLVPLGGDHYWVGSTYDWDFIDDQPTEKGKAFLIEMLSKMLSIPFEVVQHQAAIRPTVKDRRPLLGIHPNYASLAIFNGLGTKGASLGPYWAKVMAKHLIDGKPVDAEVNINRFIEFAQ